MKLTLFATGKIVSAEDIVGDETLIELRDKSNFE